MRHFFKALKFTALLFLGLAVGGAIELGFFWGLSHIMKPDSAFMTWLLVHVFGFIVAFFYDNLEHDE